jgi:para-nitrobenzyl esterase
MTDDLVVETEHGPVRGISEGTVRVFRGIRYAAPPTDALRWRAPEPPAPWREPADASRFGPAPVQPRNAVIAFPPDLEFDEDCLFLNVWAAESARSGPPRPVLVWVHGGAYVFGGTAQRMFDGNALTRGGEVILVTVGYRVGPLGFLDLSRFGSFDPNPALHDVLAALRWVQANIAAFGGDPGRVTLFGESAGAGIVTTLLTSPAASGLFTAAIAESSPATSVYDQDRSERVARMLMHELDTDPADVGRLRDEPADRITAAGHTLYDRIPVEDPGVLAFAPVIDGDLVPEHPVSAFARGGAHPIPLLIGTNRDETALFTHVKSPLMPVSAEALATMTADLRAERPDLDVPSDAEIASAYSGLHAGARGPAISRDLAFRMPTVWIAEGHSAVAPTYLYRFDWSTPMLRVLGIGPSHGTELPYVWGNLDGGRKDITFRLGGLRTGRAVSARLQARWIGFATTGVPDADDAAPAWPRYGGPERRSLIIDRVDAVADDLDAEGRRTWGPVPLSFP